MGAPGSFASMSDSTPLRLAVTNVTLGNGGDAAILYGVERALRAALPPFRMTVFGTQPEVMAPYYPDLDVVAGLSSVAWPQIAKGIPARARLVLCPHDGGVGFDWRSQRGGCAAEIRSPPEVATTRTP